MFPTLKDNAAAGYKGPVKTELLKGAGPMDSNAQYNKQQQQQQQQKQKPTTTTNGILKAADLRDASVCPLETSFDSLRGFIGKLDGGLEKSNGEFRMYFSCDPQTELLVDILSCRDLQIE